MKRKRIQYNEINEEIYGPKYWTRTKLIIVGFVILIIGFLFNFSLEDKVNKWLQTSLGQNEACPILFEKAELSYFLPKITIRKPVILGACFAQINNRLPLDQIKISFSRPSFYPLGIKLHAEALTKKTTINLYPTISPFSQYVDIEDTKINGQLFSVMTADNVSPIAGNLSINGFLKFASGSIEDGQLEISSNDFYLPAQNLSGFEMTMLNLKKLSLKAKFTNKDTMQINQIAIGSPTAPLEIKLKGNLLVNHNSFINSGLQLNGTMRLSNFILSNFEFIKIFLPPENTSGTYQMKINGTLGNIGKPQFN